MGLLCSAAIRRTIAAERLTLSIRGLEMKMLKALYDDENGFVVSAELVLVLTIGVLSMIVGLHAVSKSITQELNDVSSAFGAIDQSFSYNGLAKDRHASMVGSGYADAQDDCDCTIIIQPQPRIKYDRSSGNGESH